MDDVFVPWEDVFVYADVEKANNFFPRTGFLPRALIHGCTRLAVKLDFITGLLIKATEITGARSFRGVEANIGEVIAWRNMIWGLSDAMAKTADPWTGGCVLPGMEPAAAYQVLAPEAYVQIKNLIEKTVASGLIYLNSHAKDFKTPDLRKYLDLYLRGSGGVDAVERVKLMKLLWDAVGTEFGGRHELYEINYSGSHEEIRRYALFGALASGQYDRWKQFAETVHGRVRPRRLEGEGPRQHRRAERVPLMARAFDDRFFRAALGRFTTGVIVLSTGPRRAPHAMTANAFLAHSAPATEAPFPGHSRRRRPRLLPGCYQPARPAGRRRPGSRGAATGRRDRRSSRCWCARAGAGRRPG